MKRVLRLELIAALGLGLVEVGCRAEGKFDPTAGAPPPARVEHEGNTDLFQIDHPEQFPLVTAARHRSVPELNVTGVVSADVSRSVPVISLASGRVVAIHARLGDTVVQGQLLVRVISKDIAAAFAEYRRAAADEKLAHAQRNRSQILYGRGAIAQKDLEVAVDAGSKATVGLEAAREQLKLLGGDVNNPSAIVDIHAPVSGVITEQNVTKAAGVRALDVDDSPSLFTITDLSSVWILCDVYENDLARVHGGDHADIHITAYPGQVLRGRIEHIAPVLDQSIRTAKVRIQVHNPGMLRIGMFVTAIFYGRSAQSTALVPAAAVLHLRGRDWVYVPAGGNTFRRIEVVSGKMVPGRMQEIVSGIEPGQRVVANALVMTNTVEQ